LHFVNWERRPPKAEQIMPKCHAFVVFLRGRTYPCSRTVSGTVQLRQLITVEGLRTVHDPIEYGTPAHPEFSMSAAAKVIALQILSDSQLNRVPPQA